jgi:peptidoglycan-N-acetylglucosamine deacetylase
MLRLRFFRIPHFLMMLSPGRLVWRMSNKERKIFLTFDDGPDPDITPHVLNLLKKFGAKATFFCKGANGEKYPVLIKQIIEQGHSVGNHTYSHKDGWKTGFEEYIKDIEHASHFIPSELFRPPYGHLPFRSLKKIARDYHIIMWSMMSYDFDENISGEKIVEVFLSQKTVAGSIWVFHDTTRAGKKCLKVLPVILKHFTDLGYKFENLDSVFRNKKKAASARGNGIEDKREIGEIFRGNRNSQYDI